MDVYDEATLTKKKNSVPLLLLLLLYSVVGNHVHGTSATSKRINMKMTRNLGYASD